ncbi:MAG: response regulator [Bacteriovoracaceae bacterium]|nr:response regulator [Bacteriovoracaceae bacterium]
MGLEDYFTKRVMVVDDLPNIRTDLIKILNSLGFTNIKEMPDGKAALDELVLKASEGKPYEIIFSDINMPIMGGLALLKALRATTVYKKTPIFMVSTENEKDIILTAVIEGATDYIIKPYSAEVVKQKVTMRLK